MILRASNIVRAFPLPRTLFAPRRMLRAVNDVSLDIAAGETVALVGESGSGKTTLGRIIAGLERADSGTIRTDLPPHAVQMVFQDSAASLNPRRSLGESVMMPLLWARRAPRAQASAKAAALLDRVGLPAASFFDRLPHTLSGGQRQRVGIARALAASPRLLIADEPVSALDVSVRAQILRLFAELRAERGLACLFITHDLGVVRAVAERTVVMFRGAIVEQGATAQVMDAPSHPYTQALRAATPVPDPGRRVR
jgi:ABC-type glutathione transport system ATPase component